MNTANIQELGPLLSRWIQGPDAPAILALAALGLALAGLILHRRYRARFERRLQAAAEAYAAREVARERRLSPSAYAA